MRRERPGRPVVEPEAEHRTTPPLRLHADGADPEAAIAAHHELLDWLRDHDATRAAAQVERHETGPQNRREQAVPSHESHLKGAAYEPAARSWQGTEGPERGRLEVLDGNDLRLARTGEDPGS